MKKLIFILATFYFFTTQDSLAQIKMEFGGGYIHSVSNERIFTHINNGIQGSVGLIFPFSQSINFTGKFIYQSRSFNKNSFHFIIPLIAGYTIPIITNGDDLKSYGMMLGTRVVSKNNYLINSFFEAEAGLIYYTDATYELNTTRQLKYSESKTLFEYSLGVGFIINLSSSYKLIINGKLSHIPDEKAFYLPINLGFQMIL